MFIKDGNSNETAAAAEDGSKKSYEAIRAAKKRKVAEAASTSKYCNLDYILKSAAEAEKVWSNADVLLTKRRLGMSPQLFEVILYLKYNKELWDLKDVMAANKRRKVQDKAARAEKRMQDMEAHDAEEASLVEQVGGLTI